MAPGARAATDRVDAGRIMPSCVAHVMFDLDGTLVDSRADLANAVNHVLASFGCDPLDPRTVHRYVGDGARALVERALGPGRRPLWSAGVDVFLAYYREHALDRTCLYPGVGELLAAMDAVGVSASVLTNKPVELSCRILEGLGVLGQFVDVVGGDSLAVRKPHPDGVRYLLRRAEVGADGALLVGDSVIDAATARAAGVRFCGVTWGFTPEGLVGDDAPTVSTADDLARLILGPW